MIHDMHAINTGLILLVHGVPARLIAFPVDFKNQQYANPPQSEEVTFYSGASLGTYIVLISICQLSSSSVLRSPEHQVKSW